MPQPEDQTANMPPAATDIGAALRSAVTGRETPTMVPTEQAVSESIKPPVSDLDSLVIANEQNAPAPEATPETPEGEKPTEEAPTPEPGQPNPEEDNTPYLELKVKGQKDPQRVPVDPANERTKELLGKGLRFDTAMSELAAQKKQLQAQIEAQSDYKDKAAVAERIESARSLMEDGFKEQALATIFGENTEAFIDVLVEDKIRYQNASPEEQLQMDLDRQKQNEQLAKRKSDEHIAKLEAQIDSRSEQVRENEYTGYIQSAQERYDLSKWVEDEVAASSLNDMLRSAAIADITKLQRQREASGEANITQRDILRAYAKRAKQLIGHQERQSSKIADTKIAEQATVATQNAQAASTTKYAKPDILADWKKSGGRMTDLVDLFARAGGSKVL